MIFGKGCEKRIVIHIVLVEPEIPQNTGNISRTCAATGCALHLIEPLGFDISEKAVRRAGLDYWKYLSLTVHKSFEEFEQTAKGGRMYFCTTKAEHTYSDMDYNTEEDIYFIFGRESFGLPERILKEHPEASIRIPMIDEARSLNLSNAVAVITYEALRQQQFGSLQKIGQLTGRID